jgi:transcriptional regulator with XRE-family HTH domain
MVTGTIGFKKALVFWMSFKRISQADIARKSGISEKYLCHAKQNDKEPSRYMRKILNVFGVDKKVFYGMPSILLVEMQVDTLVVNLLSENEKRNLIKHMVCILKGRKLKGIFLYTNYLHDEIC